MLSWLWSCLVVPTAVVARTYWIECNFVAKALNLSMRLLRKDALSMTLLGKPELSINICRESLYIMNVAFGHEKNNPVLSGKKNLDPDQNSKPPPLNIKGPCLSKKFFCIPYGLWLEANSYNSEYNISSL